MRWACHVACIGYKSSKYRLLVGKPEDLGEDGRTILKSISQKYDVGVD
jgi:hypothetical protein